MFGDVVRAYRQRLGLTQQELAKRSGLSVRGLRDIEAGRVAGPRWSTVCLLADAFGLSGADRDRFGETIAAGTIPPPSGPAPAQLPLDLHGFAGREKELGYLDKLVAGTPWAGSAVIVVAISGTAGVGKTTLAVHWAHQVAATFPDGQLYLNLREFDPTGAPVTTGQAVRRFLDAFGVPPQQIPVDLDARVDLYRSLLAGRRVLVVLDNARDAAQVRPLLPGSPGCLAVVTSRDQLYGLAAAESAHLLTLDLLSTVAAHALLSRRLGEHRVAAEPHAVRQLIARCAGLPLALAITAARAAAHPSFKLAVLETQLRQCQPLDAFASTDPASDVRAVLSWSYQRLGADAARLFRLLGLHPGPDVDILAVASLAGAHPSQVQPLLTALAQAHLFTEHRPGRYTFHDLLRIYATELAHARDSEPTRRAAVHRLLDHYLHTAYTAAALLEPNREQITIAPPYPGVTPVSLANTAAALSWFTSEHPTLVAAVRLAADHGFAAHAWQLAWALNTFFSRQGHWHDQAATQRIALDLACRLADPVGQAHAHSGIARAYLRLGRYDNAGTHLHAALHLYRQLGDPVGQARVHNSVGFVLTRRGRYLKALVHTRKSLDLFVRAGHRDGHAQVLNDLGWNYALLGNYHRALTLCRKALKLMRQLGDRHGLANTYDSLGYAHHRLGNHPRAITCYQRAVALFRLSGERYLEAETHLHLADTYQASGQATLARQTRRHGTTILSDLDVVIPGPAARPPATLVHHRHPRFRSDRNASIRSSAPSRWRGERQRDRRGLRGRDRDPTLIGQVPFAGRCVEGDVPCRRGPDPGVAATQGPCSGTGWGDQQR